MRVACTRCKTAYDIPPEKLTDEVLKIRCSRCGHVFGVRKKKDASVPPPEAEAMGAAAPPPVQTTDEPPPRPVIPQLPEESFEEEGSDDIHWLDEIDIPKIEDVIEAVHKKMAAVTPQAPATIPVVSRPPAAPEAAPDVPSPSPLPQTPVVPPAASRDAGGSPQPSVPPLPKASPAEVPRRPPATPPPTTGGEASARPDPVTKHPHPVPQPTPAGDLPQAAPATPHRRFSPAGIVLLLAFLLCAGSAGFVSATRPETFAFLASRLTNLAIADAGIVIDEPVVAAQISRPDKRPLFVVTGWVRGKPLPAEIRVEAKVYGVRGVELASGDALCGTLLTEEDLVTLADSEIVSRLHRPSAGGGTSSRLPFMIVIPDPPRGIEGHAERILPPGGGG